MKIEKCILAEGLRAKRRNPKFLNGGDIQDRMPFIAMERILDGALPVHAFYHQAGLEEQFGGLEEARKYLRQYLKSQKEYHSSVYQFLLAGVWGDNKQNQKVLDFAGFSDMDPWPGNPDIECWNIWDGAYIPGKTRFCGDFSIALGNEEGARRGSQNLEHFAKNALPSLVFREPGLRILNALPSNL